MGTLAQASVDVPLDPMQASERLAQVVAEHGFTLAEGSVPGAAELVFEVPQRAFRNGLRGVGSIEPTGSGSTVHLQLDMAPGESKTLLDGRRNRGTLRELEAALADGQP